MFESTFIEKIFYYFQGGVRKSFLIFSSILLILIFPFYFLGIGISNFWFDSDANEYRLNYENIVTKKLNLNESDYILSRVFFVPLANNETVLYAKIDNRNNDLGYLPFIYQITSFDEDKKVIWQNERISYLLPNSEKYLITTASNEDVNDLEIKTLPGTISVSENAQNRIFKEKYKKIYISSQVLKNNQEEKTLELSFDIKNNDILKYKSIDLIYIIRDDRSRVVGIGEYNIQNLRSFEERKINFKYPQPRYRKATIFEVQVEMNYLDATNFVFQI